MFGTSLRPRILVLPISAALILGLMAYKRSQPPQSPSAAAVEERRPVDPLKFAALDSQNQLVKFERYLGRHEILLIFFDGDAGADRDPAILRATRHFSELKRRNVQVVGVSAALPQHNRQAAERHGPFPFPLLSDPEFFIHRLWGRYDEQRLRPLTGVFAIDRAGRVAWSGRAPQPVADLDQILPPLANEESNPHARTD